MILLLALTVAVLYGVGTWLILQRSLSRIVIGITMMGHGANLLLLASGGRAGLAPFVGNDPTATADPLPQALALTAIVITFGVSGFLLSMAHSSWLHRRDDEVEDDVEDRRIAVMRARLDADAERRAEHEAAGEAGS